MCEIQIGTSLYNSNFLVVLNLSNMVIICNDWLTLNNVTIDFPNGLIYN